MHAARVQRLGNRGSYKRRHVSLLDLFSLKIAGPKALELSGITVKIFILVDGQ
jgi:hypothetical protein